MELALNDEQVEKVSGGAEVLSFPTACPDCGSPNIKLIEMRGHSFDYTCLDCGYYWLVEDD